MDSKKLDALRARYADTAVRNTHNPTFKRVIDRVFSDAGLRLKPYAGFTTFLGAPLALGGKQQPLLSGLDVALIGVPMDLGVTNRAGARLGPRAVRAVERIGPYHHVHRLAPVFDAKVADVGDVPLRSRFSLQDSHEDIERFYATVAAARVAPLSVGGDHSITLPILKALGAARPLAMVHIDAHCDTGAPFEGSKFHHGGPFRQATLAGVLDSERTIQIGIRGGADYLWEFSYDSGMTVIHAEDLPRLGIPHIIEQIHRVVGDAPVYVSFDVDGLDPAFAPGTGTPEIGGLSTREALALLRGCAGLNVVAGDVVEVAPQYDATTNTAQAAAQMLFEILSLIILARKASATQ
jgi:agmatinase